MTDAAAMFIYLESVRYQGDDIGASLLFHLDLGALAAGPAEPIRVRARHGATRMIHRPLARVEVPAGQLDRPIPVRLWMAHPRAPAAEREWGVMSTRLSRPRNTRTVLRSTRLLLVQGKNGEGMATITVTLRTELDPGPCALRVSSLVRYPSSLDDREGPHPYYTIHMRTSENLLCAPPFAPPPGALVEVFAHVPTCPGASLQIRRAGAADVKATRHRIQAETGLHRIYRLAPDSGQDIRFVVTSTCPPECGGSDRVDIAFVGG